VRVLYEEGIASHFDPESCDADRKVVIEALTGESASSVLSREIVTIVRGAAAVKGSEWLHWEGRQRKDLSDPARSETRCEHGSTSCGN
jgi:hypothetical protein